MAKFNGESHYQIVRVERSGEREKLREGEERHTSHIHMNPPESSCF
jgi:hypothetical protein